MLHKSLSLKPPDLGDSRAYVTLSIDESKVIAGLPDRSIRIWDLDASEVQMSASQFNAPSDALIPVSLGRSIVVIPEYIQDYRLCLIEKELVVFSIFLRQFYMIDLSTYI